MRTFFPSDSFFTELSSLNPQSWLQVERGKFSKSVSSNASSSIESLIPLPELPILPFFKPADYVEVLSKIQEELESCSPSNKANLYLLQYQIFKGLGEVKLMRRSLRSAWRKASNVHEKLIFGAWLRYQKQDELANDLFTSCTKCTQEFEPMEMATEFPHNPEVTEEKDSDSEDRRDAVVLRVGNEGITCDRKKMASLSSPFRAMLNGHFAESAREEIDLSKNKISFLGLKVIVGFSSSRRLSADISTAITLEVLLFARKFCCESLKNACDRRLATCIDLKEDALEFTELALDEDCPVLAASCLQFFLHRLPESLNDDRVVRVLTRATAEQRAVMVGSSSYSLYSLLSEVSMNGDPSSENSLRLARCARESASSSWQVMLADHVLGFVSFARNEHDDAGKHFANASAAGHAYSSACLARIESTRSGKCCRSYERLTGLITTTCSVGWMYQERSLYSEGAKKWEDLERATQLDPTLTYPYMNRSILMIRKKDIGSALDEINAILGFRLSVECLELRFCIHLAREDYRSAVCDIQAILTLSPDRRMFGGRVAASQLRVLVREHAESWTEADCWMELYERWSSVDDVGSLSVIYEMLESDSAAKGILYFRQSLLLLRLNCQEAAMRSLRMARENASSEHERLVYEGWILYDTGHCVEGLQKAEEAIRIKRSFEAFFLKAYALADSTQDGSCFDSVVSLLQDALSCPSDRLRKGQALTNLGSVYVDCGKYDLAADCYTSALKLRHTRAHQGLARVHFLKENKADAYEEMTRLIEKVGNNASAYEKRSEYCEREQALSDLEIVTRLDPLRVYPYRYRAAVFMDDQKENEAIGELTRAIAFKVDVQLLYLRAAFHEHVGDVASALRDCRACLALDPTFEEVLEFHRRLNRREA